MSVEAPLSKYRKHNLLLIAVMLAAGSVWFWYDAHYNQKFITKHTVDGVPDSTLHFNLKSPPFLLLAGVIFGVRYWMIKDRKIVASDKELVLEKLTLPYDRIESIDKTFFNSKGFFVIHYKDDNQQMMELKICDKNYDNLPAVLDYLTTKITG